VKNNLPLKKILVATGEKMANTTPLTTDKKS
jgi:hypothetical protein